MLLLLLLLFVFGCRKEPDPEPGFSESFYVSFTFQNETIRLEEGDVKVSNYWSPGPVTGWGNHFGTGSRKFDVEFSVELGKRPAEQGDIFELEGKTLAISGDEYPKMQLYLINNQGGQSYSTGVDPIDYGEAYCIIDQVVKGPRIDVDGEKKRSYVLRGGFSFNISKNSWSAGETVVLYPITEGEFSIRVFLPSE